MSSTRENIDNKADFDFNCYVVCLWNSVTVLLFSFLLLCNNSFFLILRRVRQGCAFSVLALRWRRRSLRVGSAGCGTGDKKQIKKQKMSKLQVGYEKEDFGVNTARSVYIGLKK